MWRQDKQSCRLKYAKLKRGVSAGLDIQTPLIVPSFSSRGFADVAMIHGAVSHNLYGVSLISAPDIANGFLPPDALLATNVVVLDSGGYETNYVDPPQSLCSCINPWSLERYRNSVTDIQELANVVAVSLTAHPNWNCRLKALWKTYRSPKLQHSIS